MGVTIIVGATGSGKSDLAERVAGGNTIINADSQQVYRSLPTLRATPASQPNYALYAYLDDHQRTSAVEWADRAARLIAQSGGAVVVGGTALYIQTLVDGAPPVPAVSPEIKLQVSQLGEGELRRLVEISTPGFRFTDRHRVERAAGVFLATGRPITEWQCLPRAKYRIGDIRVVYTTAPTKPALRERILMMIEGGALDEVRGLDDPSKIAVRPIGLDVALMYLRGEVSRDQLVARWTDAMYQYSRRQCRFFDKLRGLLGVE